MDGFGDFQDTLGAVRATAPRAFVTRGPLHPAFHGVAAHIAPPSRGRAAFHGLEAHVATPSRGRAALHGMGQPDTLGDFTLPDGTVTQIASVGADQTLYTVDGLIITSDGMNIIDPSMGSVTWQDAFGTWHTDTSSSVAVVDPSTGLPTNLLDQITRIIQSGAALSTSLRQIFGGPTPSQLPIYAGGTSWRMPDGTIVTGIKQASGNYLLPNGQLVAAATASGGLGGFALAGALVIGAFLFLGGRRR